MAGWLERLTDRREAGRLLAQDLGRFSGRSGTVVLGLPRGGVVVAFEIAQVLDLPLDVYMVRKLGAPGQEELAFGAIASGGARVLNDDVVRGLRLDASSIEAVTARERTRLEERELLYRGHRESLDVSGEEVILVDDGLATGASMRIAVRSLRDRGPQRIIVAVPVAPAEACTALSEEADEVVCHMTPSPFYSIGSWYEDFSQTSDQEVIGLLEDSRGFGRSAEADSSNKD